MEQMTFEEIKRVQIEILDVLAKFCEERGIKYWIDAGTLLGAIRHKGYIPWDDDVDVGMLRPDYDRFIKEFSGTNPRYEFRCPENDHNYPRFWGRLYDNETSVVFDKIKYMHYGLYIDVVPYDNAPDDDEIMKKMFRKRDILKHLNLVRWRGISHPTSGNILRKLCVYAFRIALKMLPKNYFIRKLTENAQRYASDNTTKRVGNFSSFTPMSCDKSVFSSFIDVEFEGKKYKAPAGYDAWLRAFYGDYMQLPPPEKRVSTHPTYKAYRK